LFSTSESEDQVESWFLLYVVVWEQSAVFQSFSSEDESLLVGRDSFLVLDLGLDLGNAVRNLNFQGYGFSSESFDEYLHSTSESEDQMYCWFFLNVVVREQSAIF
jgi:hypothetical protein